MLPLTNALAAFIVMGLAFYTYHRHRKASALPFPPGPRKLPLIGNLLDMPPKFHWVTYAQWGKDYNSGIIHLNVAGLNLIIINSVKVAADLFEKKSSIYSSRKQTTMAAELMGWKWLTSSMPYGEPWKERRRLFQKHFHAAKVDAHRPREIEFVRQLLPQLLENPENFLNLSRHMIGGVALSLAYGLNIKKENDPYITLSERAIASLGEAAVPGKFLVDSLPFLKHLPAFFPGAGFKKKAAKWRKLQSMFREEPFAATVDNIAKGIARPSFTSMCLDMLDENKDSEHQREVIKDVAAIFFAAGSDTTISAIHTFFLAMLAYPNVQAKVHQELDEVVGRGRLPDFSDEQRMPYLNAVIKEVLRWQPATPIAVPHYASEDDTYDGYHIPAGSVVIGNVWAMQHDEEDYPDPFEFKPERYFKDGKLNPEVRDPLSVAFGFGRRTCPGSHIALSILFILSSSFLSVFKISKALDEDGNPIEPTVKYMSGLICHPVPFKCTIKPRSPDAETLIRSFADQAH